MSGEQAGDCDETGVAVWHLAERDAWEAALTSGRYDRSTRGGSLAEVGFVHASRPDQLPAVARALYAGAEEELVVLEIDPAVLADHGVEVRVEPGDPSDPDSEHFPHLYGAVPVAAVARLRPARVDRGWLELGPWEPVGAGSGR
ncbi:DUF952 domain-containing protein [Serinicoccus kebangsaanensis]|uniref:DUF952 domain-containing protein n=1 Tax=Serinicoccus kebangsaanensis TaxID=2602069 RepID=UPI00124E6FF2|nr:DUF952 domain-containing protein [Serinicoccus kebangsaanensis]